MKTLIRKFNQWKQNRARLAQIAKYINNGMTFSVLGMMKQDGIPSAAYAMDLLDMAMDADHVMTYDPDTKTTTYTFTVKEDE